MFRIWKETQDDEGNNVNKSIQVKNQKYLEEHLLNMGIGLTKVNFFSYNALPDRSYGVFIVSEEEWIAEMPDISGDIKLNLTIEDQYAFKVFKDLSVVRTAFIMSPIAPGAAQDNRRLLLIELELDRGTATNSYATYDDLFVLWDDVESLFDNGQLLEEPDIYALNFYNTGTPYYEVLSYLCDVNFLTVYLDPEDEDRYPVITQDSFDHTTVNPEARLIYNNVSVLNNAVQIDIYMYGESQCLPNQYTPGILTVGSAKRTVEFPERDTLYESPVNTYTLDDDITFEVGYSVLDSFKMSTDSNYATDFVINFADAIGENAKTRLQVSYDLIYEGVVDASICNDLHHIDYEFSEFGLRTRLRSRHWSVNTSVLVEKNYPCEEKIFKATLVTHMSPPGGYTNAVIATMGGDIIDVSGKVFVPSGFQNIFKWYRAGTALLVYRPCKLCSYYIIQGPCPPATQPPLVGPPGKCCVSIDNTNYCFNISEDECTAISSPIGGGSGSSWSEGDCDPNPSTACNPE